MTRPVINAQNRTPFTPLPPARPTRRSFPTVDMLEGMVEEEEVQQELEKKELAAKEALNADRAGRVEDGGASKS